MRVFRRDDVHERRQPAGFERAPRLAKASADVAPMVGAVTGRHDVESGLRPRQRLDGPLPRFEIGEPAPRRFGGDRCDHRRAEVVGDDALTPPRQQKRQMSAATAEVERHGLRPRADQAFEVVEILAARMHGAGDVGLGARTELIGDDGIVGS